MDNQMSKVEDEYYCDGSRIEKKINTKGDVTIENYFGPSGKLETTFEYLHNSDGICIEESEYNSMGQLVSKIKYTYDDANVNKIETIEYADGEPKKNSTEITNKTD